MTAPAPRLVLGAPGVYRVPAPPVPSLDRVRLDVTAFVGVAPRGPVGLPVAIGRFADYERRFGGTDGPGLLPFAVRAFFAQGGEQAWVVRIAPPDPDPTAIARHRLVLGPDSALALRARDEGSWGDRLAVRVSFASLPRWVATVTDAGIELPPGAAVPAGSLLRLRATGLPSWGVLRRVVDVPAPGRLAVLEEPGPAGDVDVTVVTAEVTVTDRDPTVDRTETFAGLGLYPEHPRFLPRVLADDSLLVAPDGAWADGPLPPGDGPLGPVASELVRSGADRWAGITGTSFVDDRPGDPSEDDAFDGSPGDPTGGSEEPPPHRGVDAAARVGEVGLLVVPDLFWAFRPTAGVTEPAELARPEEFRPCPPEPEATSYPPGPAPTTLLDPLDPADLTEIENRQRLVVDRAQSVARFVALLDVPPRLPAAAIARWRAGFDSSYAAAYHPWPGVTRPDDPRRSVVSVPPSAFAAGILAARERRFGLAWGAANELAAGAVSADVVTDAEHDTLHPLGINVYRVERDGVRLTAARTLARDPEVRQLSVRRLMTVLALTLDRDMQWVVFEPNTPALRRRLRDMIVELLRGLFRDGAFTGATEQEAFFVDCDDRLNPPPIQGLGRLVAEIGVAPSAPLEFLVLRLARDVDGDLRVVDSRA